MVPILTPILIRVADAERRLNTNPSPATCDVGAGDGLHFVSGNQRMIGSRTGIVNMAITSVFRTSRATFTRRMLRADSFIIKKV